MTKEMKLHLKRAELELNKAREATRCGWCRKNIEKAKTAVNGIASLSDATDKTADVIATKTEAELEELGGKVGVLKQIVKDSRRSSKNSERLIMQDDDANYRGISVVAKKDAVMAIGGALVLGTGGGYALNRIDEQFQPLGTQWYAKLGPMVGVVGGAALMLAAMSGKVKKEGMKTFMLTGGAALLANGALKYVEGMTATAPIGAYRMNLPRYAGARPNVAKPVGVMMPNLLNVESY